MLAQAATAATEIGCSWCVDFGYFMAHQDGLDIDKLRAVPEAVAGDLDGLFTDLERQVIAFAVAGQRPRPVR